MQGTQEYYNDVWAFDTMSGSFGTVVSTASADPDLLPSGCKGLPMNDNLPQTNVHGNTIFVAGGECDARTVGTEMYGHYPRLAMVGTISEAVQD